MGRYGLHPSPRVLTKMGYALLRHTRTEVRIAKGGDARRFGRTLCRRPAARCRLHRRGRLNLRHPAVRGVSTAPQLFALRRAKPVLCRDRGTCEV